MKKNEKSFKKEHFINKYINSGEINIDSIFNNNISNNKKKFVKKKIKEIEKHNLINRYKTTEKKKKEYHTNNNLFENTQKEKENNFGNNHQTKTNSNRENRCQNDKKYIALEEVQYNPKYDRKIKAKKADELKSKKVEYKIETIFNYPIKFINNKINVNNYFSNNKKTPYSSNSYKNKKNYLSIISKIKNIPFNKKGNILKKENQKKDKYKTIKENVLNKKIKGKNDTEIKYINNDNEDVTESNLDNKYDKEKIVNINDDFVKMVDSLNNEEDEYYNEFSVKNKNVLKNDNLNYINTEIIFDDELSRISKHPEERKKNRDNKNNRKNRIESPIKLEFKNKIYNTSENIINNDKKTNKNKNNGINLKKNEFNKLLDNKTFKKFLKNKIKLCNNVKDIPINLINSLEIKENKNDCLNTDNNEDKSINYDYFYEYTNYKDYNDNTLQRKKNFRYNTNYEKLENDNFRKTKEIQKLKEKLNNQKKIIIEKKEIINDLQNINNNLIKEVNILKKNCFHKKKDIKYIENPNKNMFNNDIYDYSVNRENINEFKERYNSKFNNFNYLEVKYDELTHLSYNDLMLRKKQLIEIRKEENEEYSKLSNEKESCLRRNMLEKNINKINISLKEIRSHLKKNNKQHK